MLIIIKSSDLQELNLKTTRVTFIHSNYRPVGWLLTTEQQDQISPLVMRSDMVRWWEIMNEFLGETNTGNHEWISVICKDRLSQYINNSCYIFHVNDVKWNLMHSLQIFKKSHWFTRLGWLKLSNIPQPGPTSSTDWRGRMYEVIQPRPDWCLISNSVWSCQLGYLPGPEMSEISVLQLPTILQQAVWRPASVLGWPRHVIIIVRFQLLNPAL